jgi:beta-glucosidase/6-phospho-beta-glucosidase/beta-galactosidase
MQFQVGWLADPLFFGDYPPAMRASQRALPAFKESEKRLLRGSVDFLALNYYTSNFVSAPPPGAPASQVRAWVVVVARCVSTPVATVVCRRT